MQAMIHTVLRPSTKLRGNATIGLLMRHVHNSNIKPAIRTLILLSLLCHSMDQAATDWTSVPYLPTFPGLGAMPLNSPVWLRQ